MASMAGLPRFTASTLSSPPKAVPVAASVCGSGPTPVGLLLAARASASGPIQAESRPRPVPQALPGADAASFRPPVMGLLYPPISLSCTQSAAAPCGGGSQLRLSMSTSLGAALVGFSPFITSHGERIAPRHHHPLTLVEQSNRVRGPRDATDTQAGSRLDRGPAKLPVCVAGASPMDFDPLLDADTTAIPTLLRQREYSPRYARQGPCRYVPVPAHRAHRCRSCFACSRQPIASPVCAGGSATSFIADERSSASLKLLLAADCTAKPAVPYAVFLVAYPAATADSQRLLAMWRDVNDEIYKVKTLATDAIRITTRLPTSTTACLKRHRRCLQDLDMTELTAVQVLVGTRMGLKPRRSPIRMDSMQKCCSHAQSPRLADRIPSSS